MLFTFKTIYVIFIQTLMCASSTLRHTIVCVKNNITHPIVHVKYFIKFLRGILMATFSERLRELRKKHNLTQKALGELVNSSERGIQSYELEQRKPTLDVINSIADYFNVSVDYLTGRCDEANGIFINEQTRIVLSDRKLSLEAKGLYMQLRCFTFENKAKLPDEELFLKEYKISKKEFDSAIRELEKLNYIKIESSTVSRNSEKIYIFTDDV